jgi:hypothetical protein
MRRRARTAGRDVTDSVTLCDRCGERIGAPHRLLDTDCLLGHQDHTERHVGYLCRRHYSWVDRTLTEITELYALVPDALLPGPGSDIRSGNAVDSPAPGNLTVMAITDRRAKTPIDMDGEDDVPDVIGTLTSWARVVAEQRHVPQPDGNLATSVRILRRERHWIAGQDWVDDYAAELGVVHRWFARAVGDTMWPKPIGRCPNDGTPLFNTVGLDEVTCRKCKATWAGIHLARLRLIFEQQEGQ